AGVGIVGMRERFSAIGDTLRAGPIDLVISPLTAKSHIRNILRKLDCHDRAALVALAYESGLISPGEAA
ncbi:MAG: LuxR C-terminal-related transcriptional regulator, partial [Actinomycetota bacterium]|nr:LuxR C-terminal-related transcriptional regulator [Actinomycetota bacterium]